MPSPRLTITMDADLKVELEELAENLGLSSSATAGRAIAEMIGRHKLRDAALASLRSPIITDRRRRPASPQHPVPPPDEPKEKP